MVDAEGDTGKRGLLGVAFYSDQGGEWLTDRKRITTRLEEFARAGYTFAAHNAEYDASVIWWQLGLPMRCCYYNDTFNRGEWKWHPKRPAAQLWDTLDLSGRVPLATLGEAVNLPKLKTPQQLLGVDPDRYAWTCETHRRGECLECYGIRDAEIVYRYLESLAEVVTRYGAELHRRIGSTGFDLWRKLDRPEPIRLRDHRCRFLGRQAYYGGRVECFKLGRFGPLYAADINSMYPSVMTETPFPDPAHMVHVYSISPDRLPLDLEGAAEATVCVPHSYIPPLPNAWRGQRLFAAGQQRGTWALRELRYAQSLGTEILAVHRACWSTRSIYPFGLFVGTLWELREAYRRQDDPRELAVKAMLNHTYGRFGMRSDLSEEWVEEWDSSVPWSHKTGARPFPQFGALYQRRWKKANFEHRWINELWAAQITAAARVKLHRCLQMQGGNVVYCDTDSVFSLQPIEGLGSGLGQLSDPVTYRQGWILGPKLYRLESQEGETVYRAAGVSRELAERFLRGEEVVMESPITPLQAAKGRGTAGQWVQVKKSKQLAPYRRTPLSVELLNVPFAYSDTLPPAYPAPGTPESAARP